MAINYFNYCNYYGLEHWTINFSKVFTWWYHRGLALLNPRYIIIKMITSKQNFSSSSLKQWITKFGIKLVLPKFIPLHNLPKTEKRHLKNQSIGYDNYNSRWTNDDINWLQYKFNCLVEQMISMAPRTNENSLNCKYLNCK